MDTNDLEKAIPTKYGITYVGDNTKPRFIYAGDKKIYQVFVGDTEVFH